MIEEPTLAAASRLLGTLDRLGYRAVLIGGLAVGLIAKPRFTRDVDAVAMVDLQDLDRLVDGLAEQGFIPLFRGADKIARLIRILPLADEDTRVKFDLALGATPLEQEIVDRATDTTTKGYQFRLPTPEDLLIPKAIAHRPTDLQDIHSIVEVHPRLDRSRTRFWVEQYGDLLDEPDLWTRIEPLLESD